MALRADSYSSTSEVKAFTRHLLDGQTGFNSTTRPTATELERFIDRASGVLNLALAGAGFATPVTNSTAKLALADWVTERAAEHVELTQRGVGFSDQEGSRTWFRNLHKSAADLISANRIGFVRLGVTVSHGLAEGVQFTGQTVREDRADPDDTSLEQPLFRRRQFDDNTAKRDQDDLP